MGRILVYRWMNCCEDSIIGSLERLGQNVDIISGTMENYDTDVRFENAFKGYFENCSTKGQECSAVFSVDYFPLISRVCESEGIPYISWLADYPMTTVYSKTIHNSCNRVFAFDKNQDNEIAGLGSVNVFYMPLATDINHWDALKVDETDRKQYAAEVSFVGTLYNDSKSNKYSEIKTFPPYIKGYLDGIISAQLNVYGYNFIEAAVSEQMLLEIKKYLSMELGPDYYNSYSILLSDILNIQVSMLERKKVLEALGNRFDLALYTGSDVSEIKGSRIRLCGYADYMSVMPKIFRFSKINLNITSKSITSGISQRVFDVMGNGGFLISNYQPELAMYFEDGREIVLYESIEDLEKKVEYYLIHEDERQSIAAAGYDKVRKMFSYEKKLADILRLSGVFE